MCWWVIHIRKCNSLLYLSRNRYAILINETRRRKWTPSIVLGHQWALFDHFLSVLEWVLFFGFALVILILFTGLSISTVHSSPGYSDSVVSIDNVRLFPNMKREERKYVFFCYFAIFSQMIQLKATNILFNLIPIFDNSCWVSPNFVKCLNILLRKWSTFIVKNSVVSIEMFFIYYWLI